jgi:hypothetical protein
MPEEHIRALDNIGFIWKKMFANLDELRKYKELNGDCNVPSCYLPNPRLGVWVR